MNRWSDSQLSPYLEPSVGSIDKLLLKGVNTQNHERTTTTRTQTYQSSRPHTEWTIIIEDEYNDTTNPDEHIDVYKMQMDLYTSNKLVWCWVFPTSLKGETLIWFTRLPFDSVDSFKTLLSKLGTQFATNRPHHLTFITLVNIQQEKGKSLRTFMERFSKLSMNIRNASLEVAIIWHDPSVKPVCW